MLSVASFALRPMYSYRGLTQEQTTSRLATEAIKRAKDSHPGPPCLSNRLLTNEHRFANSPAPPALSLFSWCHSGDGEMPVRQSPEESESHHP